MYQSRKNISCFPKSALINDFLLFLSRKGKIYCKHLGRSIFLEKLPEILLLRKDSKNRLECFFVAIDIIQHSHYWKEKIIDGFRCYEAVGYTKNNDKVSVHIREEIFQKDKKFFFISCFHKKTSHP